jgi:hypothetical protein
LKQIGILDNSWYERQANNSEVMIRFEKNMEFADKKHVIDGIMIEKEEMFLKEVALLFSQMSQFIDDYLALVTYNQLQLLLVSSPEADRMRTYLDALRKFDFRFDRGKSKSIGPGDSNEHFLIGYSHDVTGIYPLQIMYDFIDLNFGQYQAHLDRNESYPRKFIDEVHFGRGSLVESQFDYLLHLQIVDILEQNDIVALFDLVDCQLGFNSYCNVPLARRNSVGCHLACVRNAVRFSS